MVNKKNVIGLSEYISINGNIVLARVDTRAQRSSIDLNAAKKMGLGSPLKKTKVISVHGHSIRNVFKANIEIAGRKFKATFNTVERKNMRFKVLIGRNILRRGFLIDTTKK